MITAGLVDGGAIVGVGVFVCVGVVVGAGVGVDMRVGICVAVAAGVGVDMRAGIDVGVDVSVDMRFGIGVDADVGVDLGAAVGLGTDAAAAVATDVGDGATAILGGRTDTDAVGDGVGGAAGALGIVQPAVIANMTAARARAGGSATLITGRYASCTRVAPSPPRSRASASNERASGWRFRCSRTAFRSTPLPLP